MESEKKKVYTKKKLKLPRFEKKRKTILWGFPAEISLLQNKKPERPVLIQIREENIISKKYIAAEKKIITIKMDRKKWKIFYYNHLWEIKEGSSPFIKLFFVCSNMANWNKKNRLLLSKYNIFNQHFIFSVN